MIVLSTDYGAEGPYVGQVKAAIAADAPDARIVDLQHDLPRFNPRASAYLIPQWQPFFPPGTVFLCVVDPEVGSARRGAVALVDGYWYVGPDNGLLSVVVARGKQTRVWQIVWTPELSSATFHGRDIFAPIAALIVKGAFPADRLEEKEKLDVDLGPHGCGEIVYIDHYGNVFTGLREADLSVDDTLSIQHRRIRYAHVFSAVAPGELFWHFNSLGLAEIAGNRASASEAVAAHIGDVIGVKRASER